MRSPGSQARASACTRRAEGHRGRPTANRAALAPDGGATVADAQKLAYQAVDRIDWAQGFCRRDIGWRAVGRAGTDST